MDLSRRSLLVAGMAAVSTPVQAGKSDQTGNLQTAIDKAAKGSGIVHIEAGRFITTGLRITDSIEIVGVPGRTVLLGAGADEILTANGVERLTLFGITFEGKDQFGDLVKASDIKTLSIEACTFRGSRKTGLSLERCSGRVSSNDFADCEQSGIFAVDSKGLEISSNHVRDMGNNGIQVWASEISEDGTLVINNRVHHIKDNDGGTGQYGNGISIFRAGNVIVSNNRLSDCAFSGVRCNSGHNTQILGNSISRMGEVSIYVEFAYEGAVVSGNVIEDSAFGISITNFNDGGRLTVCTGNLLRKLKGGMKAGVTQGGGIHCEADTLVSNNIIEDARDFGISMGWGPECRNLTAQGNLIRNCGIGIMPSVSKGAGPHYIMQNVIDGSRIGAIVGKDYTETKTGDLGLANAEMPEEVRLTNNVVKT
jgi:uncharacterized secreted repeat protein (TIGR03808 family)